MKIYALLIGINDYKAAPLKKCIHDTLVMEKYLEGLNIDGVEVETKLLHDSAASKENIVKEIPAFLGQASDDDVALLYYSGHGVREDSAGRFF